MSRLQAGMLALQLEAGVVVTLIGFHGDVFVCSNKPEKDVWEVYSEEPIPMLDTGNLRNKFYTESKNLMPLGDKKTRDDLAKEKEIENA